MQSLRIYCSRCHKEDTASIIDEINKVCAELGIRGGVARLSSVGNSLITGKRAHRLKREETEVAKQVALRLLTMITDSHVCESCRETMAEKQRRESLRKKFKIIVSKEE
jgi:hypothetical protein